jgi:phospholipid-translocating ATPase
MSTKNESIEENMNTNVSVSESPITSFETVDTTNLVTENESILTQETIVTENTISSPGEVKETIISTPAITEQIISAETKVSMPTITETVESTSEVVTKSESNKKTIENDEFINNNKVNETEMNSSEDFNEKIEQKNSKGNDDNTDNTLNRAISNNSNHTTGENNPDNNEEEIAGSPLKRTKTKIRNRTSTCKERRVYANIDLPKEDVDRKGRPKYKYVTNKIVTSKYTLWTFIPKNLFEQFRRAANLYFLFMAVLGMLPFISVNNPVLTVLPLSVVVFFTALKDGIEDRNRHKIDKQFNSAICYHLRNFVNVNYPRVPKVSFWKKQILRIKSLFKRSSIYSPQDSNSIDDDDDPSEPSNEKLGPPSWKKVTWRNVRVGDFLYLRNNDAVPADAIILSTSEPEGTCFVETKDLDGETNLKPRRCVPDTKHIRTPADCENTTFYIDSEKPNSNLYSYSGALIITEPCDVHDSEAISPSSERSSVPNSTTFSERRWKPRKTIPIDINNLLLRAHVIRNTEWIIAITVFTGVETKIMLNSSETPSKRSRIEKEMNQEVNVFLYPSYLILII